MFADLHASFPKALFVSGLLAAALIVARSARPESRAQATSPAQKAEIVASYGNLSLSFEANTGRSDRAAKFISRGRGYGLYLTATEAVLTLCRTDLAAARIDAQREPRAIPKSGVCGVVRMQLAGANGHTEPMGEDPLPGTVNYFIGSDPAKWRTGVPTYAQVRYTGIYRGIDLAYHGNPSAGGQLEFDFAVAPNADPQQIRMRFGDSNHLRLEANGDLTVAMPKGALAFRKPSVYQLVKGHRRPVTGEFALLGKHSVGFRLGSYDRAKELVIDPVLAYSTLLGGTGGGPMGSFGDLAAGVAVDNFGNAYVAGQTCSTDFPVTAGAFQTTNPATVSIYNCAAFVTKLSPSGRALVYSTYLGGKGTPDYGDIAEAIALDTAGNVYVTGQAYSPNFPVTSGAFQATNHATANQESNAFVAKLNPTGTALVYSTYFGGSGQSVNAPHTGDSGNAIAVDAAGDAYVAGQAYSTDFPVTQGAFQTTNHGAANINPNAFVSKVNTTGTALVYSTYLGGSGGTVGAFAGDSGNAVALDAAGDAYAAGQTYSADYPVTSGAFQITNHTAGGGNAFVTKLNSTGAAMVYSTYLGGSILDGANAIAVDAGGNAYVAGAARSPDFPVTSGAFQTTNYGPGLSGGSNAFAVKLNPGGTALVYSTFLGGSGGTINLSPTLVMSAGDEASGLAIDSSGNAYVTGSTASGNFPVTQGAYQSTNDDQPGCPDGCISGYNGFITELNSTGTALVYSTFLGGNGFNPSELVGVEEFGRGDRANALALDNSGNVYVTGTELSLNFPVTVGAFQTALKARNGNAFVAKLNMSAPSPALTPTVTVTPASSSVTTAQSLNVTVSVSGGNGNPTPTGMVTLHIYLYESAVTPLNGGSATITIPAGMLPPGVDTLTAEYYGDANYVNGVLGQAQVDVPIFTITGAAVTLKAGATTGNTSMITVTPGGGFTGSVALTAAVTSSPSGAQNLPTLSFGTTSPVNITGTAAATATLTINTAVRVTCTQAYQTPGGVLWYVGGVTVLAWISVLVVPVRRRQRLAFATLALLVALTGCLLACGGSSSPPCTPAPGTTPGMYTIYVTGTSGTTIAEGPVELTVQ